MVSILVILSLLQRSGPIVPLRLSMKYMLWIVTIIIVYSSYKLIELFIQIKPQEKLVVNHIFQHQLRSPLKLYINYQFFNLFRTFLSTSLMRNLLYNSHEENCKILQVYICLVCFLYRIDIVDNHWWVLVSCRQYNQILIGSEKWLMKVILCY